MRTRTIAALLVAGVLGGACSDAPHASAPPLQPGPRPPASAATTPKTDLAKPPPDEPPTPVVLAPTDGTAAADFDIQQLGDLSVPTLNELKAQVSERITPENADAEMKRIRGDILGKN